MTDEERTRMKAAAKLEDLELDADLANLDQAITKMLGSVPEAVKVNATDPAELKQLITAIKNGTAANNQSARFLEIITRLAR
jgi:hypothetical protein